MSKNREGKEPDRKLPSPCAWLRGFQAASTTRIASACQEDFAGFYYQPEEPRNITFTEFFMKWFILGEDQTAPWGLLGEEPRDLVCNNPIRAAPLSNSGFRADFVGGCQLGQARESKRTLFLA